MELLTDIANELGVDKSHLRRWAIDNGFLFDKVRSKKCGNQMVLALADNDAQKLKDMRMTEGYMSEHVVEQGDGYLYIIQLLPNTAENRVKLGYAKSVAQRLSAHRTTCPNAVMVNKWKCKPEWELVAIDSITRDGCELVGGEVYECVDIELLEDKADRFFELMPELL